MRRNDSETGGSERAGEGSGTRYRPDHSRAEETGEAADRSSGLRALGTGFQRSPDALGGPSGGGWRTSVAVAVGLLLALTLVAGVGVAPAGAISQDDGGADGWFGQDETDQRDRFDEDAWSGWFERADEPGAPQDGDASQDGSDGTDWLTQDDGWFSFDGSDGSTGADSDGGSAAPSAGDERRIDRSELETAVHERVNEARAENGLGPLSFDDGLREVARYHSGDMAASGYFSHTSPSGETLGDRYARFDYECRVPVGDYRYKTGGENIFMYNPWGDVSESELADTVVSGWMDSDGHRRNILDEDYRREGIGAAVADDGSIYVTQNFC